MERSRQVTLVLVDSAGSVLGVIGPLDVSPPWWQETGVISDLVDGVTVLRLLHGPGDGEPGSDPSGPMGGAVIYAAEVDDPSRVPATMDPWPGSITADLVPLVERRLGPQPHRHHWAEPGGPASDLNWVGRQIQVTGTPRQHRTWNLSAIWSIPTTDCTVWLKCVPDFFAHEGGVLSVMADQPVPQLLAADRHRLLLAPMAGEDGYEADPSQEIAMIDTLVTIQTAAVERVDELLAAGVPDLRAEQLGVAIETTVRRSSGLEPEIANRLAAMIDQLDDRLAAVSDCGLPNTLVHGDPHGGNCRIGVDPPVWFDWGDSFIGNPMLDLAAVHRMNDTTVQHWLDRWSAAVPGSDPERAWQLLRPMAEARMAWVYQRFVDNIEPAEHVFHRGDVNHHLRAAAELA